MIEDTLKDVLATTDYLASNNDKSPSATGLAPMVMIVEDDEDIACSLAIRLGAQGLRSCTAGDAIAALEVARTNEPDVAILDINMPGGDGFDVARELRNEPRTLGIPIIFLTASMRPGLRAKAQEAGAAAFMAKPYDASVLMATVKELVEGGRFN